MLASVDVPDARERLRRPAVHAGRVPAAFHLEPAEHDGDPALVG
ncbi:hypothetical protein [Carbonactinospora thermoautotrophica]|nr:hypothetical protein [Carbonactinospora thermoautotrophica]